MIKAVFFDFYGTLAGWEPAAGEIQRAAAAAEGLAVDAGAIERAYLTANALLDRENAVRRIGSRTPEERYAFFAEYERTLLSTAGYDASETLAAAIWARVRSTPKGMALYPDALPALEALRDAGFTLGVISNMGTDLPDNLAALGVDRFASVSVSSGEVGVAKPHREVFWTALRKAGVEASEALHVGDGYESDVLGATRAGLQALFLLRDRSVTPPEGCATVRALTDVLGFVRQDG
jgi:putative hydrolase of the HAD superfamily